MLKKVLYVYRSRFRPLSGNKGNQRKRIQLFRILRNVTSFRPLSGNKGNQLCYLRFLRYRTRNGFRPLSGNKGNQRGIWVENQNELNEFPSPLGE